MITGNFVGQLLHPNVEADAKALAVAAGINDKAAWPEDTIFSTMKRGGSVWYTVSSESEKFNRSSSAEFDEEQQELQILMKVSEEGEVTVYENAAGSEKKIVGTLPRKIRRFFDDWKEADIAVMANNVYAIAYWYEDDLISWHEARLVSLRDDS